MALSNIYYYICLLDFSALVLDHLSEKLLWRGAEWNERNIELSWKSLKRWKGKLGKAKQTSEKHNTLIIIQKCKRSEDQLESMSTWILKAEF